MMHRAVAAGVLATTLALAGVAVPATSQARAYVGVSIGVPPPPRRVDPVRVRVGYVWAPGYWRWNGARHVWVGGYWLPTRHGYRYAGAAWVPAGPHWRFRPGAWVRS